MLGTRSWHRTQPPALGGPFPWALRSLCLSRQPSARPSELPAGLQVSQLPDLGKHVFIKQKCMVFYINEWQLTNIQWCSALPQNPPQVSQPGCFQPHKRGCGLGGWVAWAGCRSERRGRAICPTLKRNPGKEDRKAPSEASRCSTEIKLLPCNGSSSQRHQADLWTSHSLLSLIDSISVYCSWGFLLP